MFYETHAGALANAVRALLNTYEATGDHVHAGGTLGDPGDCVACHAKRTLRAFDNAAPQAGSVEVAEDREPFAGLTDHERAAPVMVFSPFTSLDYTVEGNETEQEKFDRELMERRQARR